MSRRKPPRVTPTLPQVASLCLDAVLTVAQIGAFFSILWLTWFIVWIFG